jgi:hypothetical protein
MAEQSTTKGNAVQHPDHYAGGRKFEPKDVIRDWELNFNLGNAVKYISRAGRKDDIVQDLKKAQEYIQFELDAIEAERLAKVNICDTCKHLWAYPMCPAGCDEIVFGNGKDPKADNITSCKQYTPSEPQVTVDTMSKAGSTLVIVEFPEMEATEEIITPEEALREVAKIITEDILGGK